MNQWKPIASASLKSHCLLLYRPGCMVVGYYGGPNSGWRISAPGTPAMWPPPTYWMPLVESPGQIDMNKPPNKRLADCCHNCIFSWFIGDNPEYWLCRKYSEKVEDTDVCDEFFLEVKA